ncbi:MAG TPA: family 1 glycosylhydrolase [Pseudonocardiaceae bacterium]|jgi:beta-glucosidase|nr:family 1 glycosylhydrolase [Pseudonocardiaceae bacterium]
MSNAAPRVFPEGFLWGAATAGHQTEGNNVNSDYWQREYAPGSTVPEPSGDACDSYHRYPEDIALLAGLGFNTYRFSLEWSRIEPERGHVSKAEIEHYRRMVGACHDAGLTPMVTLNHFTVPRWMRDEGWWREPAGAERFARFTEAVLPILRDGVPYVCTINEPNIIACGAGAEEGGANLVAYGLARPSRQVSEELVRAHRMSREVLSAESSIASGWTVATQAIQAEPGYEKAAREYSYPLEEYFLEASRGDDFVGVQAYTRTFVGAEGAKPPKDGVETTLTGWEYFPAALGIGVRNAWQVSGHVPVVVTENGIATADDNRRIDYTTEALAGLHDAITDGVDVRGYLYWSALDNYEWGRYSPTFGLIAVDRSTFRRTVKPSAHWLGRVARENALAEPAVVGGA